MKPPAHIWFPDVPFGFHVPAGQRFQVIPLRTWSSPFEMSPTDEMLLVTVFISMLGHDQSLYDRYFHESLGDILAIWVKTNIYYLLGSCYQCQMPLTERLGFWPTSSQLGNKRIVGSYSVLPLPRYLTCLPFASSILGFRENALKYSHEKSCGWKVLNYPNYETLILPRELPS